MTAFECAKTVWLKTILFGTVFPFIISTLNAIIHSSLKSLVLGAIPFIINAIIVAFIWSLPQFLLTVFTLEWIFKMEFSVETKTNLTALATLIYSFFTVSSFINIVRSELRYFDIQTNVSTITLFFMCYIVISAIIMHYEATTFFQQDKIP